MFKTDIFSRIVHTSWKSRDFQESYTLLGKVEIFKNRAHFSEKSNFSRIVHTSRRKCEISKRPFWPERNCCGPENEVGPNNNYHQRFKITILYRNAVVHLVSGEVRGSSRGGLSGIVWVRLELSWTLRDLLDLAGQLGKGLSRWGQRGTVPGAGGLGSPCKGGLGPPAQRKSKL